MAGIVPEEQRHVEQAPVPGVRLGAAPTATTFGAPVATAGENIGLAIYAKEVRHANETAVLDADTQLARTSMDIQAKMQDLRGKDAMGAPEFIKNNFGPAVDELSKTLSNDEQRTLFQRRAIHRSLALEEVAQRHMATEQVLYQDQVTDDTLKASVDNARLNAENPEIIRTEKDSQALALVYWAQRHGVLDSPQYAQRLAEVTSKTNTEVIKGLLYTGKDLQAKAYYDANKADFTAADRDGIEKTLEEGSYRGDAQRKTAEWVSEGKDLIETLREVEKIDNPKLQQVTRETVKQHFDDLHVATKRVLDNVYQLSTNMVDNKIKTAAPGQSVDVRTIVPPDAWTKLSLAEKSALQAYADHATKPADRPNDNAAWLEFYTEKTPDQIAALSPRQFQSAYWQKFDNAHRHQAETYYTTIRNAFEKKDAADPKLTESLSYREQIKNTWQLSGLIDPSKEFSKYSKEEAASFSRFEQAAATALQDYELTALGGKRKASPEERQQVLNGMRDKAIQKVWVPGTFFGTNEKALIQVEEDQKGRATVPIDKIPKPELQELQNYILSLNKTVTLDKLRRAYAQWRLFKNRAAFDAIVNE